MALPQPRPGVLDLPLYVGGKSKIAGVSRVIKLSSNEAALGPSPKAVAAYEAARADLAAYPVGPSTGLREAVADIHGLDPERIICGCGSDEILNLLCRAYAGPGDEVVYTRHGFLIYGIYAASVGAKPVQAEEKNLTADVDTLLAAVTPNTKLVFIANPNNPTGTYMPKAELERLRGGLREDILLVIDGAYAEFMTAPDYDSGLEMAKTLPNVVATRTFSKIYGLASLRIGWGTGAKAIIDALERLRAPFNTSGPAQAAAIAAVRDQAHVEKARRHNTKWMGVAIQRLRGLGLKVVGEHANFVSPEFPATGPKNVIAADEFLQSRGIIARRVEAYGLPNHLRISIGDDEATALALDAVEAFMKQP